MCVCVCGESRSGELSRCLGSREDARRQMSVCSQGMRIQTRIAKMHEGCEIREIQQPTRYLDTVDIG